MHDALNRELAKLRTMSPSQLRKRYLELYGEPTRTGNKDFLCKRIAWRMQSETEGTLSERARARARELARDADIRTTIPKAQVSRQPTVVEHLPHNHIPAIPPVGTVLTRNYRGRQIQCTVLPKGFEYDGQVYRSLTAVTKAVTGSHWNGHLFFGLRKGAVE